MFPPETSFGLILDPKSLENKAEILANYDMNEISAYDMNFFGKGSKKSSGRLASVFYILEKK